jgi:integrase
LQQEICNWISELKKSKSSSTISSYVASLVKFTNMNDITGINWPIVHSFEPEKIRRNYFDRPYTREEFQQLIEKADYRNKVIILLMSCAGLRVGALRFYDKPGLLDAKQLQKISEWTVRPLTP